MAYEDPGAPALDYLPCRYGKSKLLFRGPRRKLAGRYIAAIGGTETYGKYVPDPFPALLERDIGLPVVNFGYMNAGIDVFCHDPAIAEICADARLTLVQVVGAHNMSNRYYSVHPRRNDRFLRASTLMGSMFRNVDFTEVHFTRHLLSLLKREAPDKFGLVAAELKQAWSARMTQMLAGLGGRSLLVWIDLSADIQNRHDDLGPDPLLVDEDMVCALVPVAGGLVRIRPSPAARAAGTDGMIFPPLEAAAAHGMPGPQIHAEVAAALAPAVRNLI